MIRSVFRERSSGLADSVLRMWMATFFASLALTFIRVLPMLSLAQLVVIRPLVVIFVAMVASAIVAKILALRREDLFRDLAVFAPIIMLIAACLAATGWWNDGSGTVALTFGDARTFVISLGLAPMATGPESLLRFAVLAVIAVAVVRLIRKGYPPLRVAACAAISWIVGAFALLIPSWMVAVAARLNDEAGVLYASDIVRLLGKIHAASYWSAFQSDRFFTPIGKQLESATMLSAAAILFIFASLLLIWILADRARWFQLDIRRRLWTAMKTGGFLAFACSVGLGWWFGSRSVTFSWHGIDWVACVVGIIVFGSWFFRSLYRTDLFSKDGEESGEVMRLDDTKDVRMLLGANAIFGSALLGWSVFCGVGLLAAIEWFQIRDRWTDSALGRAVVRVAVTTVLFMTAALLGFRSVLFPSKIFLIALGWGIWSAIVGWFVHEASSWTESRRWLLLGIGALPLVVALRFPTGAAVFALVFLALRWIRQRRPASLEIQETLLLAAGVLASILALFIRF